MFCHIESVCDSPKNVSRSPANEFDDNRHVIGFRVGCPMPGNSAFVLNVFYHIFALCKTAQNPREAIFRCLGFPSYRWANDAAGHAYIHKSVDAVSPLRAESYQGGVCRSCSSADPPWRD